MFAMVAIAGYRIVLYGGLDKKNKIILGVTLGAGLVTMIPGIFDPIGEIAAGYRFLSTVFISLKIILQSAVATGGILAIIMNALLH